MSDFSFFLVFYTFLIACVCMPAKSPPLYPTLCDAMDAHPPGFSVRGFSRQEYWSQLSYPPPGDLPDPGIKPASLCLLHGQVDSLPSEPPGQPTMHIVLMFLKVNLNV